MTDINILITQRAVCPQCQGKKPSPTGVSLHGKTYCETCNATGWVRFHSEMSLENLKFLLEHITAPREGR
jgi:DnaJ-class molecular chaperone